MTLDLTPDEIITVQAALATYLLDRRREEQSAKAAGASGEHWTRQADMALDLYDKIENACCERA